MITNWRSVTSRWKCLPSSSVPSGRPHFRQNGPAAGQATDIYLTALAILLTVVYLLGLLFRPKRRIARMGTDSLMVLVLYGLGIAGLFVVASA